MALLTLLAVSLAQGEGTSPTPPDQNSGTPPTTSDINDETKPLKERLEEFYTEKERYIEQKRQCKEESVTTNAPSGTCWDRLKPMMQRILLKQVILTEKRLIQLKDRNITFHDIEEINAKLTEFKAVFENSDSSKFTIKSAANNVEDLINKIEEKATWNQTDKLIKQMDNIMEKADALTNKLETKLNELKASGYNTGELEKSLDEYKTYLAETKKNIAEAKAKYEEMGSAQEINLLAKEVRTFINNAKNYLEKGFDKARTIVPEMSGAEQGGMNQGSDGMNQQPQGGAP